MLTTTGNRETLNAGRDERQRPMQPLDLGSLETFHWQCPYCHRSFEAKGYRCFQPKRMTCGDCAAAYEAKIRRNFVLRGSCRAAAVKIGQSENRTEQREYLDLWRQLAAETSDLAFRLEREEMIRIAENYAGNPAASTASRVRSMRDQF